ncbi:M48 family metallopeptidase [Oceaniglobus trochenteri]|uniref:M48 family metallopeptidase n=1 Tax=Oceaniglobus trochenteri TaxID=2763260 RepID=UPI001CFFAD72|nr:M48 family metallopeptidase [Oceaniglobus trochenteri]
MSGTVIHIGAAPAPFAGTALYLDGQTAGLRPAQLRIDEGAGVLVIRATGMTPPRWPLADVRAIPDQADPRRMVLAVTDDPVARLLVEDDETLRLLRARCPNLHRRPKPRGLWRLFLWALAALGAVALIVFLLVPLLANRLAEFLPPEGERALGEATLDQVRHAMDTTGIAPLPLCETGAGQAALAAMTDRLLARADLPYPLQVQVLDHPLINAFALPGGQVVLFRGLIEAAEHPDEIAGVLAHEIGHVAHRDPTRIALRSAGSVGVLGLLFGDFAGGAAVLFLTERLISATYTREAEAGADDYALSLLAEASIDPGALGVFFERLRRDNGETPGVLAHFMDHPATLDRIEKAANAPRPDALRPALDAAQWQALRGICGASPPPG